MIWENNAEEKARTTNDEKSGLLSGSDLSDGKTQEQMRQFVTLLQSQTDYCGQKGVLGLAQANWCYSDTFALLNLIFLLIYVLDVVFKVSSTW